MRQAPAHAFADVDQAIADLVRDRLPGRQRGSAGWYLTLIIRELMGRREGNVSYAQVERSSGWHRVTCWRIRRRLERHGLAEFHDDPQPRSSRYPKWGRGAMRYVVLHLPERIVAAIASGGRKAKRLARNLRDLEPPAPPPSAPPPAELRDRYGGRTSAPAETGA